MDGAVAALIAQAFEQSLGVEAIILPGLAKLSVGVNTSFINIHIHIHPS